MKKLEGKSIAVKRLFRKNKQYSNPDNPIIQRILILTMSWQTIRAATANPVEALRYE
jgi:hypothetical protein